MDVHAAAEIMPFDEDGIPALAEDIGKNGLLHPVQLFRGSVIDGRRRLRACEIAGVAPTFATVTPRDPVMHVLSLNLHRRHLTTSQRAMIAARVREIYDRDAKERQKAAGKTHGRGKEKVPENLPEPISADARDQAGKALGVSGKSVDHATTVLAKGTKELIQSVDSGRVAVSRAATIAVAAKPKAPPKKMVGVVIANDAINVLLRIPKDDPQRRTAGEMIIQWAQANLME